MKSDKNIFYNADDFIRELFRLYLVERDFKTMVSLFHEDITWIGTGEHEICNGMDEAINLLEAEKLATDVKYKIVNQWYKTIEITSESKNVYGEIEITVDGLSTFLLSMRSRFSMICVMTENGWKLIHSHISVPNPAQSDGEFIHSTYIENYNKLLEEKLVERTQLLKDKSLEFEALTNNLVGGVQICKYDDDFTVSFMSNGFNELTGYTKEEFESFFENKHMRIIHGQDVSHLRKEIAAQLETSNSFSVEYRIVCKNGKTIWVIDKGVLIRLDNGETVIQCILTDITAYKEQEEQLKLSEKRYEIAMSLSNVTMFEYDLISGDLLFYDDVASMYNVPSVVHNGVETFINKFIDPVSVPEYREMYRKIHNGEPTARCFIKSHDANGGMHDFELSLTNVFDKDGKAIRAIGVRKNISQIVMLQRENEFGKNLAAGKTFIFEADLSLDKVEFLNPDWEKQIGASAKLSYSHLIKQISLTFIKSEFAEIFMKNLSKENIQNRYNKGDNLISFEYKIKSGKAEYCWREAIINIVKDENSGHICIRFYRMDISEMKKKEERAFEEQQLYESMLNRANRAYEVNVSRNVAIKGHENWKEEFGIDKTENYSEMIAEFSKKAVHPDESALFYNTYMRENVIRTYKSGENEICCQYRTKSKDGEYRWSSCIFHLYEDPTTSDIKGFSYIIDIDEQKREELTLKFNAEHDVMTGAINKATLERIVNKQLLQNQKRKKESAFLMIDIDYFKFINDNFGHLYGDNVIKEVTSKIKSAFKKGELIGRVGGDEFAVFIPSYETEEQVINKAEKVCKLLRMSYTENGHSCTISGSVGVAFAPKDGDTFTELFANSDIALYKAKRNGKNRIAVFS